MSLTNSETPRITVYVVGPTPSAGPFDIPFPFYDEDEVEVYVGNVLTPGVTIAHPSPNGTAGNSVTLDVPVASTTVSVVSSVGGERATGDSFVQVELSKEIDRIFARLQEIGQRGFFVLPDNTSVNIGNRRLTNVLSPVGPNDAATKNWVETAPSSALTDCLTAEAAAEAAAASADAAADDASASAAAAAGSAVAADASADAAAVSASAADASADAAAASEVNADASADAAAASAGAASGSAGVASGHASAAAASAAAALASQNSASGSATTATTKAGEASASADAAAASAASINPANLVGLTGAQSITGLKTFTIIRQILSIISWAATIVFDFATANRFQVTLSGASTTISNPSNLVAGQSAMIILKQDATGGRLVAWGSHFKFPGGLAPTLTAGANKIDVINCEVISPTEILCSVIKNFG